MEELSKKPRLEYLDGLRGVVSVLVVIHHMFLGFYPSSSTRSIYDLHSSRAFEWWLHDYPFGIVINGNFAVAVFLLMSGYFVGRQFRNFYSPEEAGYNLIARFIRFFLLILAVNLLSNTVISLGWKFNQTAATLTGSWMWLGSMWKMNPSWIESISQSFWGLFKTYSIDGVFNSSIWTMKYFLGGSMLVMAVASMFGKMKYRSWIYLVIILISLSDYYWLLIAGLMISELKLDNYQLLKFRIVKLLLLLVGIWLGNYPQLYFTAQYSTWYSFLPIFSKIDTSMIYHGVGAILILIAAMKIRIIQKMLSLGILKSIGKISFSLYIGHVLIINSLASFLFIKFLQNNSYSIAFIKTFGISFVTMLMMAWLLYYSVETWSTKVSKKINSYLSS